MPVPTRPGELLGGAISANKTRPRSLDLTTFGGGRRPDCVGPPTLRHDPKVLLFLAIFTSLLLAAIVGAAGAAKLKRDPRVTEMLTHLEVSEEMQVFLGRVELLAAAGLIVGIFAPVAGVVAGIGLVAFFVGAVVYHVRAGDPVGESGPAVAFGVLAVITAVLRAAADS